MEFMLNDYELKCVQRYSPVWASEYDGNSSLLNWDGITINKKYTGIRYSANIVTSAMPTEETEKLILELSKGCVDFQSMACTGIVDFFGKVKVNSYKKMPSAITDEGKYYMVSFDISAVELIDAATVFRVTLHCGDNADDEILDVNNIVIQKSFDTGVAVSKLSFQTTVPFVAPFETKIVLGGVNGAVNYYVSSRTLANGVYTVECLDKNAFLDKPAELTIEQEKMDYIAVSAFLEMVKVQFGYTAIYGVPEWCVVLPIEEVLGKTYSAILCSIATACQGVWVVDRGEVLRFVRKGYYTEAFQITEHTRLDVFAKPKIKGIELRDAKNNIITRETKKNNYEILCLESAIYRANGSFIEDAHTDIYDRLVIGKHNFGTNKIVDKSTVFCRKAILHEIPHTVCIINYAQIPNIYFECTSMTIRITSTGIYATLNTQNVDKY